MGLVHNLPSGIFSHGKILGPTSAPTMSLMITTAPTVCESPPRFSTTGMAKASVEPLAAKAKLC